MIRRLFILLCFAWFTAMLPATAWAQGSAGDLLARINGLRGSQGLPPYSLNGALSAAAQSQAQWMADTATISHVRPDGSGPRTRAVNAGYPSPDVSENIYGGTSASVDSAWTFWVNSGVHYRGLVNDRFQEVGIGIASSSWGTTYVLMFGNPGGPPPFVPQAAGSSGASSGPAAPPSYIIGIDPHGFIMHEVQPEDTLGDIALLYGYTWDDIPYMKEVNGLDDHRALQVGDVFLVPPYDGTYTPTPSDGQSDEQPTATPEPEDAAQASDTPAPTDTPTPTLAPVAAGIATAAAMPEVIAMAISAPPTATPVAVASASTEPAPMLSGSTITRSQQSPWLMIALVVQVGLLLVAGFEFMRRARRR